MASRALPSRCRTSRQFRIRVTTRASRGFAADCYLKMSVALLDACRWPVLSGSHSEALRRAVEFVLAETDPLGIVATDYSGSCVESYLDSMR